MSDAPMREATLYQRDPEKNYAFVKVGKITSWNRLGKLLWRNRKVYTITQYKQVRE